MSSKIAIQIDKDYKEIIVDLIEGRRVSAQSKRIALNQFAAKEFPGWRQDSLFRKLIKYYIKTDDSDVRVTIKNMITHHSHIGVISSILIDYPQIKWLKSERQMFINILVNNNHYQQCLRLVMEKACSQSERESLINTAFKDGPTANIFLKNKVYDQDDIQLLQANALQFADVALSYYNHFRKEITPKVRECLYASMLQSSNVTARFITTRRNNATDEEKHKFFMLLLDRPRDLMYHLRKHVPDLLDTSEHQKLFFQIHKDWLFKSYFRNDSTQLFTLFKDAIDDDAVKYILKILNRLRTNKVGLISGILRAYDNGQINLSKEIYDELNVIWATETLLN